MLYKCTYALYDDINKVGKIEVGGKVILDYDKFSFWIAPKASNHEECQSCSNYAACLSRGCPYKQKQVCNQETFEFIKCYIPQFYHIANKKEDISSFIN